MNSFRYYTVTYNPCSPLLAVPTAVYSINSLWKACAPGIYALYDPPYVLTPGGGLSVFQTTATAIQDPPDMTTTQASAGLTPAPVTASMTTVSTVAPTPSVTINPLASSASTKDPPAQPATTVGIHPPSQSPSTNDPPTQPATTANNDPVATSPGTNTVSTQPSAGEAPVVSTPATITIGSSTIIADPSSTFVIASQTLSPGGQIIQSAITYSLASNGASLVVGGTSTQIIAAPSPSSSPLPSYRVGTQILSVGGAPITVSGTVFSLPPGGSSVTISGSAQPLSALQSPSPEYQVGSQTLVAGGAAITVSGTVYSIPLRTSSVVVGGSTQPIGALLSASPEYVVGSQTLATGAAAITISGSAASLKSDGSSVVVGSETEALSVLLGGSTTTVKGIGGIIATIGGFGTQSNASLSTIPTSYVQVGGSGYNGTIFLGRGSVSKGEINVWGIGLILLSGLQGGLAL